VDLNEHQLELLEMINIISKIQNSVGRLSSESDIGKQQLGFAK
jgi:hypothetical protein